MVQLGSRLPLLYYQSMQISDEAATDRDTDNAREYDGVALKYDEPFYFETD